MWGGRGASVRTGEADVFSHITGVPWGRREEEIKKGVTKKGERRGIDALVCITECSLIMLCCNL